MVVSPETLTTPAEPTTPPKPSEYLRLGIMLVPTQLVGRMVDISANEEGTAVQVNAACALGSIGVATGFESGRTPEGHIYLSYTDELNRVNSIMKQSHAEAPCASQHAVANSVEAIVIHLNDRDQWSREQIADWLEGIGL